MYKFVIFIKSMNNVICKQLFIHQDPNLLQFLFKLHENTDIIHNFKVKFFVKYCFESQLLSVLNFSDSTIPYPNYYMLTKGKSADFISSIKLLLSLGLFNHILIS